ncbi:hypothetical protein [Aulosira sp. FACHB-615]|uniref:hypothetical protein n=1 Tax=Aulosira sp. FACHB-615 TaxID=2692777 RepID=UPI001685EED8|nr:hypothetical protein [Aulosira sp. FACHB-615]MBD2486768.1 hypothetical protein [Aulosira sp. FACHB-615]
MRSRKACRQTSHLSNITKAIALSPIQPKSDRTSPTQPKYDRTLQKPNEIALLKTTKMRSHFPNTINP